MLMNRKAKTVNVLEGPMTESCAEFPARHVFIKCPECRRVIDEARLHDNLEVCPRCGKHNKLSPDDFSILFIATGGVERLVIQHFEALPRPAIILADGMQNSLLRTCSRLVAGGRLP